MLNAKKAKEIVLMKKIDDEILKAATEGKNHIAVFSLTMEQKSILNKNGYKVEPDTDSPFTMAYCIKWS